MEIPYTWQDIEDLIRPELDHCGAIQTFGTIGSRNLEHDIDIIITKEPGAKSSDFYRQIHNVYDTIDTYVRQQGRKLIRFTCLDHEMDVCHIGGWEPGDLRLHTMTYVSLPQMRKDWAVPLGEELEVEDVLDKEYIPIKGSKEDIFSRGFSKGNRNDHRILKLSDGDRVHSNYPEKLMVDAMNHIFRYVSKHAKIEEVLATSKEDVRECMYRIADALEEQS